MLGGMTCTHQLRKTKVIFSNVILATEILFTVKKIKATKRKAE